MKYEKILLTAAQLVLMVVGCLLLETRHYWGVIAMLTAYTLLDNMWRK